MFDDYDFVFVILVGMESLGVRTAQNHDEHNRSRFHAVIAWMQLLQGFSDWYKRYDSHSGVSRTNTLTESLAQHFLGCILKRCFLRMYVPCIVDNSMYGRPLFNIGIQGHEDKGFLIKISDIMSCLYVSVKM